MKLFELFDKKQSRTGYEHTIERIKKTRSKTGLNKVGGGTYADVYDNPHDTHSVIKVARPASGELKKDGYFGFIQHVMKMDNPYFPKADELTQYTSKAGEPFFTVKMEKLSSLGELRTDEVQAVWSRILGRAVPDEEVVSLTKQMVPPARRRDAGDQVWICGIADFLENCTEDGHYLDMVQDPELRKAINVLALFMHHGFINDMHEHNIMFRRTPYGPQLVFTDPFSEIRK